MDKLILIPLALGVAVAAWLILRGFKNDEAKKSDPVEPSPRRHGGSGDDDGG